MSDGACAKPESATPPEEPVSAPACDHSRAPDGWMTLHSALSFSGSSFHLSNGCIGSEGLGVLVASCSLTQPNSAKKQHTAYFLLLLKSR